MSRKNLVAYFSVSGWTKKAAVNMAKAAVADLYEILPLEPYTREDLDWTDKSSRSTIEMQNLAYRPAMVDKKAEVEKYDTIFVGFPIWWHRAPTIINTFLESYDFSGKNIVLFATSGSSGMGRSMEGLKGSVSKTARFCGEKLVSGLESPEGLREWIDSLDLGV